MKKLFVFTSVAIVLTLTSFIYLAKRKEIECYSQLVSKFPLIQKNLNVASLVVSHFKYQRVDLQNEEEVKNFISTFVFLKNKLSNNAEVLFLHKKKIDEFITQMSSLVSKESYFQNQENKSRPRISYEEIKKQVKLKREQLGIFDKCYSL